MSRQDSPFVVRRILVALDMAARSPASLESAVELAAQLESELMGLFIEDPNLLRLAGLPFVREIRFPSATEEQPERERIERELRVRAERTREALAAMAERARVRWSFRVVRGKANSELLAAAHEVDLMMLGKGGRRGSQTLAVCQGSTDDARVHAAASHLARVLGGSLITLLPPRGVEGVSAENFDLSGAPARVHKMAGTDLQSIARAVRQAGGGVVLISCRNLLDEVASTRLLEEIGNPVLLVC